MEPAVPLIRKSRLSVIPSKAIFFPEVWSIGINSMKHVANRHKPSHKNPSMTGGHFTSQIDPNTQKKPVLNHGLSMFIHYFFFPHYSWDFAIEILSGRASNHLSTSWRQGNDKGNIVPIGDKGKPLVKNVLLILEKYLSLWIQTFRIYWKSILTF